MQQYGKYYITLKGVHYEVSQEVHDAFYQAERQERYMAACTTPTVRGGKKCDGESLDSIRR